MDDIEELNPNKPTDEGETAYHSFVVKDALGNIINFTDPVLYGLWLTIYEESTGQIINSRNRDSILQSGGCTVDAEGLAEMRYATGDSAKVTTKSIESQIIKVEFNWIDDLFEFQTGYHYWRRFIRDSPVDLSQDNLQYEAH